MAKRDQSYSALGGRILLTSVFLLSGLSKLAKPSANAEQMKSKQMPAVRFFLGMAILFEVGAGMLVLGGLKARIGALALVLYLIPVTLIFHNFWSYTGEQRTVQMEQFMKNLSIMGGLLLIAGLGPGRTRRKHRWPSF